MTSKKLLRDLQEAEAKKREAAAKLAARRIGVSAPKPVAIAQKQVPAPVAPPVQEPPPRLKERARDAAISIYRSDEKTPSCPSSALLGLADIYLHAAQHRSRHIALVWPASLKTVTLVHALATLARWREGDKQGVRGAVFPVKSNVFYPLNHLHFDREEILSIASDLLELGQNARVTRGLREKDAFLFSLSSRSLPVVEGESFNPSVGEVLPHFFAGPNFKTWSSCDDRLLALIRAKLVRRAHAKALQSNCSVIGAPATAPDALFALDGRMTEDDLRKACKALSKSAPPEVVLVVATRQVRMESPGWRGRIAKFCLMLEDVFGGSAPGVVVVTDEPHAAYRLKDELWGLNLKRAADLRWSSPHAYKIAGFPSVVDGEGLLPAGAVEAPHPAPRELDAYVVDADMAKVSARLARIAGLLPGGKEAARPLSEAASYLTRIAALPCGVKHMADYLAGGDVSDRTRTSFDWLTHRAAVQQFERQIGVAEHKATLLDCLAKADKFYANYNLSTPFAHKLAGLVAQAVTKKKRATVVFTNALYRRLAERFLAEYDQYPEGFEFEASRDRVQLISARQLEEHLSKLGDSTLVFAGLNEDNLRLLLTDDRVPPHSVVLLTQRAGQFLRATLKPIAESFPEFKSYKPRIESLTRKLKDLPDDASVLSTGDYVLPAFRVELSGDSSSDDGHAHGPDSWLIRLEHGQPQFRRETSEVYVYDPASEDASDAGFKVRQVKSLQVGDKLFVMSAELREMVEQTLRDAGVPIQSDKTFEAALRSYHEQVKQRLAARFSEGTLTDMVRLLRQEMLVANPKLEPDLPKEQAIRHWIDLGNSPNTPFEKLRPQAPLKEATFKAFASVLGFSPLEAAYQWQRVIMAVRNSRRLDGRHVSDIYAYMLLQPESAMANSSISRRTLAGLFAKARESVVTVEQVGPLKEALQ